MSLRLWRVVGGGATGGIIVREGQSLASAQLEERLATDAVVEEVELVGGRLRYQLHTGGGPCTGWVSLRLPAGKQLLIRSPDANSAAESVDEDWPTHPLSEEEWEQRLQSDRYVILREKGTECIGSGEYNDFFPADGHFCCAGCETPLYSAASKMREGCGWPAFGTCYADALSRPSVVCQVDWVAGGREILCRRCGGHLGHVFMNGKPQRHCVNSLSVIYREGPPPFVEPSTEVLCDMSTFARQLREHSSGGSYAGVVDHGQGD
mmetsp:Transcript_31851/g.105606  ORF Transcript_31851/g.105606 Transcript_31851/m.105606 type:complete len:264 (+) Transcript_31851:197-988(+)